MIYLSIILFFGHRIDESESTRDVNLIEFLEGLSISDVNILGFVKGKESYIRVICQTYQSFH